MMHRTDWHSEVIAVILAFAAVGLGLAVFSFVSKARNSVRSISLYFSGTKTDDRRVAALDTRYGRYVK